MSSSHVFCANDRRRKAANRRGPNLVNRIERWAGMETIHEAFNALVEDETLLYDPSRKGYTHAAVVVHLERDNFGGYSIDVSLSQIDGAQIAFVLDVARRHELDVREERGWLRLSRHLTSADLAEADIEPEHVTA